MARLVPVRAASGHVAQEGALRGHDAVHLAAAERAADGYTVLVSRSGW